MRSENRFSSPAEPVLSIPIDASKIERELSWQPLETFESGIRKTIEWYLANQEGTRGVVTESYRRWMALQYSR